MAGLGVVDTGGNLMVGLRSARNLVVSGEVTSDEVLAGAAVVFMVKLGLSISSVIGSSLAWLISCAELLKELEGSRSDFCFKMLLLENLVW